MADTRQVVNWALERKCAFRNGDEWFLPRQTFSHLISLRTVADAIFDNRVVDGICVTGWNTEKDGDGQSHKFPSSGFRIEDRIGKFGDWTKIISTCGSCEANAQDKLGTKVVGCYGTLHVYPDSQEFDEQLWKIIKEHGFEDRLRSAFKVTTPLWYGFWMDSPLKRLQVEFLNDLLNLACDQEDKETDNILHFLNALKAAISWELPLHVSMTPLGHTDFGWYTVFPHCPRCKANAPVGRWQEEYTSEPHTCRACGFQFNPNEHHSSERDDFDWDASSLEKQLGENGFAEFTKKFLLHRGCTEKQVEEIVDNKNDGPLLRQIADVRRKRDRSMRLWRKLRVSETAQEIPRLLDLKLSDDINLELVLVPAGEFLMGSPPSEKQANESPQHRVKIERPFYIGRFPVTQGQWKALMGKNSPSRLKGNPKLPVDQVSWFGCQIFCEALSKLHSRVFRLPSEAEWEYSCRAGTQTKFAFGDVLTPRLANFTPSSRMFGSPANEEALVREMEVQVEAAESKLEGEAKPSPVGNYPPNAWGIYDMHGNVDEWCEDVWHPNYDGAPADGSAWLDGEDKNGFRVIRGGWCAGTEFVCTSTSRRQLLARAGNDGTEEDEEEEEESEFMATLYSFMYIPNGFRVVCEIP